MEQSSPSLFLKSLSVKELRHPFREEIESYFLCNPVLANSKTEAEKLLTIQEASDFLKLTVPTIYGLTSRHELPFMKKGKRLYFSQNELLQFVKEGRQKTVKEIEEESKDKLPGSCKKKVANSKDSSK